MPLPEIRNARFNEGGGIDIEIDHPRHGWIPYTTREDDPEDPDGALWAAAQALNPEDYVPPSPEELLEVERASMACSRFQAKAALTQAGMMPNVLAAVAAADPMAQLAWAEAVEFRRTSPTIVGLAAAIGLSDEDIDDLFRAAMTIEA